MKVLGVIPARYASTRFPGKPLADINGKSMIQRVYEQSSACDRLDRVVIATDDERIFDHATSFGAHVLLTREEHPSGTDRVREVLDKIDEDYDVVINIQGDEPFIDPGQITTLIALFDSEEVQIGTLVKRLKDQSELSNPNRVKVVFSVDGRALYFSRSPLPHYRNDVATPAFRHIGLYGYRSTVLREITKLEPSPLELAEGLEQLRWLENDYHIHVAETDLESPNIDTPEDLENVLRSMDS